MREGVLRLPVDELVHNGWRFSGAGLGRGLDLYVGAGLLGGRRVYRPGERYPRSLGGPVPLPPGSTPHPSPFARVYFFGLVNN